MGSSHPGAPALRELALREGWPGQEMPVLQGFLLGGYGREDSLHRECQTGYVRSSGFIGWSQQARKKNIRYIAYNPRFLILPWVEVPHLASHLLGQLARRIAADWERVYGHPVYYLETFVERARFRGTCYRAAGWKLLGQTTGRGKDAPTRRPNRPKKEVLGLALSPRFRALLSRGVA